MAGPPKASNSTPGLRGLDRPNEAADFLAQGILLGRSQGNHFDDFLEIERSVGRAIAAQTHEDAGPGCEVE